MDLAIAADHKPTGRPAGEIAAWFAGLDLVPPGLVDVQAWRPGPGAAQQAPVAARILGGVARQPGPRAGSGGT